MGCNISILLYKLQCYHVLIVVVVEFKLWNVLAIIFYDSYQM